MERIGAGRTRGGDAIPKRQPHARELRTEPKLTQAFAQRKWGTISSISLTPLAKWIRPSHFSLRRSVHKLAQSRTIAHNSEPLDSLKPVHPMGAPRITPTLRFGTRTDREQHIEDKIYSVEEKSR
jgi:hypothetical protein